LIDEMLVDELREMTAVLVRDDTELQRIAVLLMLCDKLERLGSMLEDKLTSIEQRL
jgi:hypothetical protein